MKERGEGFGESWVVRKVCLVGLKRTMEGVECGKNEPNSHYAWLQAVKSEQYGEVLEKLNS